MNYKEKYTGSKEDFYLFLKEEVVNLFKDKLTVEGNRVLIPDDVELDFQIKIDSDETYGDFTIKVKWGEKPEQLDESVELEEIEELRNKDFNYEPFEF